MSEKRKKGDVMKIGFIIITCIVVIGVIVLIARSVYINKMIKKTKEYNKLVKECNIKIEQFNKVIEDCVIEGMDRENELKVVSEKKKDVVKSIKQGNSLGDVKKRYYYIKVNGRYY